MSSSMDWACLTSHGQGVILRVRVSPNAAKTTPEGMRKDRLSLRIKAPPVEGKANAETRRWAAEAFGLRTSHVQLLRGERAREKDLLLDGLALADAERILNNLIQLT